MTSPYLNAPLRGPETVLHTRRRAVEMTRERGWEWEQLTPAQQDRMLAHAEQETRGNDNTGEPLTLKPGVVHRVRGG